MSFFNAYIKLDEHRYREQFGLSFEEFAVGQKFKHRPGVTITQQDNKNEALDTMNNAQLHYDAYYASHTEWQHCLGVSTLTLQNLLGMTWKTFAKKHRVIAYDNIVMTHPVFGGDTLYAESEIINKTDYPADASLGLITVVTSGFNQNAILIAKAQYQILIYKKGFHPSDRELPQTAVIPNDEKFSSYRQLDDGSYLETIGLFYQDLLVNDIYEHRPTKTFTVEENRHHVLNALEWNPQYSNFQYIEQYSSGKMPINETFLIGAVTALTTRTFGKVVANLQWQNIMLPQPIYAGETISCESQIIAKRESRSRPTQGIVHAKTTAMNQGGAIICSYERHFLVYKKNAGPYRDAGY